MIDADERNSRGKRQSKRQSNRTNKHVLLSDLALGSACICCFSSACIRVNAVHQAQWMRFLDSLRSLGMTGEFVRSA